MNLKQYLKDRLNFIVVYFVNTFLVIIIMMLDIIIRKESLNYPNIIYALLLSILFLIVLIVIDYGRNKKFYKIINQGLKERESLEYIFNIPDNITKEQSVFKKLLTNNYMIYESKLDKYRKMTKTQMDFNNRWIHQMKTPVSVIKLILENESDQNIDEDRKKSYESIEEEIEKLYHGLEMALYTLRVNDFEKDFIVEEVDLINVVRNVVNENKNAFIVNSIYPKIVTNEDLKVKTDKKWIKFVVNQIISNSIKYTKVKESNDKSIVIKLYKEDDKTILSIEDNGVGIPPNDLDRVFNPFFTGENGRSCSESTGMGLYLSKDTCDRLGHCINVESEERVYTKVCITFYQGKSIYNF